MHENGIIVLRGVNFQRTDPIGPQRPIRPYSICLSPVSARLAMFLASGKVLTADAEPDIDEMQ